MNLKSIAAAAILLAGSAAAQAQDNYLRVSGSYFLKAAPGYYFNKSTYATGSEGTSNYTSTTTYTLQKISFGAGPTVNVTYGRKITDRIAAELQVSYLNGKKAEFSEVNSQQQSQFSEYYRNTEQSVYARMALISPALVLDAGLEKFSPYVKLGPVFGIGAVHQQTSFVIRQYPYLDRIEVETKDFGGIATGFHGGIGTNIKANDKFGINAEFNFRSLNYSPTKGMLKSAKVNNKVVDKKTISKYELESEYVNSYSLHSNQPQDQSKPSKESKFSYPLSGIGFSLGIHYNF